MSVRQSPSDMTWSDVRSRLSQGLPALAAPPVADAAGDAYAALPEAAHQLRRQLDDGGAAYVGHQAVEGAVIGVGEGPGAAQAAQRHRYPPIDGVRRQVVARDIDRQLVGVEGDDLARAQSGGGDREDAGAGAEVEEAAAGKDVSLQGEQAHAGGGVLAGAEGHPGVEADDDLVRPGVVLPPARGDDEAASHPLDVEMPLPGLGPVFLADPAAAQPGKGRGEGEAGEVAAEGPPLGGEALVAAQVGPDEGGTAGVDRDARRPGTAGAPRC